MLLFEPDKADAMRCCTPSAAANLRLSSTESWESSSLLRAAKSSRMVLLISSPSEIRVPFMARTSPAWLDPFRESSWLRLSWLYFEVAMVTDCSTSITALASLLPTVWASWSNSWVGASAPLESTAPFSSRSPWGPVTSFLTSPTRSAELFTLGSPAATRRFLPNSFKAASSLPRAMITPFLPVAFTISDRA